MPDWLRSALLNVAPGDHVETVAALRRRQAITGIVIFN